MNDMRLGALLLQNNVIQEEELERCLEIQVLTGGTRPLGAILVEQGLISQGSLEELLELQRARCSERRRSLEAAAAGEGFLATACRVGVSDLLVSEGRPVMVRVAGQIRNLGDEVLGGPEVWQFVRDHMGPEVLEELADLKSVTRNLDVPGACRGRITAFRHLEGVGVLARLHPPQVRACDTMGIDERVQSIVKNGKGLVLLSGGVGTGITEAMAALLHEVVEGKDQFIIVLDETCEYPLPDSESLVVRRQIGVHARSMATAFRAAVREDPDIIFVGDVGDPETFELALRAAEGGRLVVAGLHAPSAVRALQRILNSYEECDLQRTRAALAAVLRCVICLQMVPDRDHQTVVPVSEVLLMDEAAREILRSDNLESLNLLLRMDREGSGHSFDQSLMSLLRSGQVRFEDVFNRAEDKTRFLQAAGSRED